MKCPWCNEEMISGFLQSGNCVYFTEQRHPFFFYPNLSKDKEVMLTQNDLRYGSICKAYRCKSCEKVIIDYMSTPQRIY